MLSKNAIEEYRQIYKQEFGIEISDEEALEQGIKLLRLFYLIYQPVPKSWLQKTKKKTKKKAKEKKRE